MKDIYIYISLVIKIKKERTFKGFGEESDTMKEGCLKIGRDRLMGWE